MVVAGLCCVLVAIGLAALRVRALDAVERATVLETPVFAVRAAEAWLPLGEHRVPAGGALRVKACVGAGAPPALHLELRNGAGAPVATVPLDHEQSASLRCTEARWSAPSARAVTARLTLHGAPVRLSSVVLRTGASLRVHDALPCLVLALGLGLVLLAPRRGEGAPPAPDDTLPLPSRGVGGVVGAVLAFVLTSVAAGLAMRLGGSSGAAMLASVLVQQVTLATLTALLLGAWWPGVDARRRLELDAPPKGWATLAATAALLLVVVAVAVGRKLTDAGDSPIARIVEAMPMRYVVAFGAFCAPLPEEIFYRNFLGRVGVGLLGAESVVGRVIAPAVVFVAVHAMQLEGAWLGLVPIAAVGLTNGVLRWYTRGLVVPWAVHTLYNGVLALTALA